MIKSKPVFEGLMLKFPIFYCSGALAMIHLSCRTIPFLSVSQPRYIWATDLLSLTLTGSHRQMCPCLRYMLSMVLSVGCECMVSLVHKAWFDDEFFLQPLRIYKTVVKEKSFILAMATVLCLPPSLEQCFCYGHFTHSTYAQDSIYPYFWVCLYAIWHIILVDKCQCAWVQLYDVRHNEIQSSTTAFNLWGKRSLRNFVVFNTPNFFENNSNLWVWGSGPVG